MRLSFFKVPKHRVFEYRPLYYDEEKERREERKRQMGIETEVEDSGNRPVGSLIRNGGMRARHNKFQQRMQQQRRKSQILLVALIVGLSAVAYFMMREFSDEIVEVLFKR